MITTALPLRPEAPADARLRQAMRQRGTAVLDSATDSVDPDALVAAMAAPDGLAAVARLLLAAAATPAQRQQDPLADALLRGVEARRQLIDAAGSLLSVNEVAHLLGVSRQAVDKRRRAGQLLAMRTASDWRYPAAQFGPQGEPPAGLTAVIAAFAEAGPWAVLDFLLAADSALGGVSPLAALHRGDSGAVERLIAARAADAYA